MKSFLHRSLIVSNARVWLAIAVARIDRNPATICEVRDALNARQSIRLGGLTHDEENAIREHYEQQLRTYGRVEVPFNFLKP